MLRRLVRPRNDGFALGLDARELDVLRQALGELRALLIAENPASDPGVARLFPPAYPDDLLQNLDFERTAGNGLLAQRLAGLDDAESALAAPIVSEEQLMALMRSANDLRLIYGIRLEITESTSRGDIVGDEARGTFDLYAWLGWLVDDIVTALSQD